MFSPLILQQRKILITVTKTKKIKIKKQLNDPRQKQNKSLCSNAAGLHILVIWKRIRYSMVVILSKVNIKNKQTKRLLELK